MPLYLVEDSIIFLTVIKLKINDIRVRSVGQGLKFL